MQDNKKVFEKVLFWAEQLTRTDNKITLVIIKFNLSACKNLSKNEFDNLSDLARDCFLFYLIFWKYSGLCLSQTRNGPTNLFEIEKVRDRENYHKNQNFY